jgi:hypothetical protein
VSTRRTAGSRRTAQRMPGTPRIVTVVCGLAAAALLGSTPASAVATSTVATSTVATSTVATGTVTGGQGAAPVAGQVRTPDPSSTANFLTGVSATSRTNAWAVGYFHSDRTGAELPLILHWNGRRWTQARGVPAPGRTFNFLFGVSATSAKNAWAVGRFTGKNAADDALILHWNGRRWTRAPGVPNPSSTTNTLFGVAAVSAKVAWAVGQYRNNANGQLETLVLRWNGRRWRHVGSPNPSPGTQDGNVLYGVTATSAASAWAVGYYFTSTSTTKTLILHWNGRRWTTPAGGSPSPSKLGNFLFGVTAVSNTNAWAVGQFDNATDTGVALVLHWDGRAWRQQRAGSAGPHGNSLLAVSASSATRAFATGVTLTNVAGTAGRTLILRLRGSSWSTVRSGNHGTGFNTLTGVSATSAANAWAVGYVTHNGITRTLAEHWNGRRWS